MKLYVGQRCAWWDHSTDRMWLTTVTSERVYDDRGDGGFVHAQVENPVGHTSVMVRNLYSSPAIIARWVLYRMGLAPAHFHADELEALNAMALRNDPATTPRAAAGSVPGPTAGA